jgi:hypothetical protein
MSRLLVALALPLAAGAASAADPVATSCMACHGSPEWFADEALAVATRFRADVHAEVGLSCHDCHGGNPDPALAEDMAAAMDESFAPNPYRGVPDRAAIPGSCGSCHSDPVFMKRFKPDARVDQEQEYWTSHHGMALRRGDTRVATCVDCHGVHGILRPADADSPVYPTRVAETCGRCHADPTTMAGSTLPDGRPLPLDQLARWRQSIHAVALLEKGDLSAPTCNDCHGNHGATPPGLDSLAFVCGQCHGREAELFRASTKRAGFEAHNEYLAGAGADGCAACHEAPEVQAGFTGTVTFSECSSCHGHHGVVRPTLSMLWPLPETPCFLCHEGPESATEVVPEPAKTARNYRQVRDALLAAAQDQGLAGKARFDWLVDRALTLPPHTLRGEAEASELRPEFSRLFAKFRIGKTYYTYDDPAGKGLVREELVQCGDCHAAEPQLADEATGLETSSEFLHRMQELIASTARAERIVLAARRGGVETRPALAEIDQAVDAQIELEVLVHSFSADPGGAFAQKHRQGLAHGRAALVAGQEAHDELAFRRQGLAVSLVFIVLVLIVLALRIHQLGPHSPEPGPPPG